MTQGKSQQAQPLPKVTKKRPKKGKKSPMDKTPVGTTLPKVAVTALGTITKIDKVGFHEKKRAETLKLTKNPILFSEKVQEVRIERLKAPCIHRKRINNARREMRDLRKAQTASQAIAGLDHKTEIFGFTKGQFSLQILSGESSKKYGPDNPGV